MRTLILGIALTCVFACAAGSVATAGQPCGCGPACEPRRANSCAAWNYNLAQPWHGDYYHTEWGTPVALVVPPTAEKSREMGWGVGNTRMRRIYNQFGRQYPGEVDGGGAPFRPTPQWPSDTTQFGVYYVRGPW